MPNKKVGTRAWVEVNTEGWTKTLLALIEDAKNGEEYLPDVIEDLQMDIAFKVEDITDAR